MTTQPFQVGDQVRWAAHSHVLDRGKISTVKYVSDDLLVIEEGGVDRPVWPISWRLIRKVVALPEFYAVVGDRDYHHIGDRVFTSLPLTLEQAQDYLENTAILYGIKNAFIAHFRTDGTWGVVDET